MQERHGLTNHPLYQVWADIKTRCYDKKSSNYHRYGGRGISMCDEWRYSFPIFYTWAISNGYERGLEIDRYPNNDGNYEPVNCRWATRKQNADNKSTTAYAEIDGIKKSAKQWSEETGINRKCIYHRIKTGCVGVEAVYGKPRPKKYNK